MNEILELIIFDLGGIIVPEAGEGIDKEMAKELGLNLERYGNFVNPLKPKLTIGEMSLLDLYTKITSELKIGKDPVKLVRKHLEFYECEMDRDSNIIKLVDHLMDDYRVVCLTNTEIEIADFNKKRGLFDFFEKAYLSTEMRMMKPDKEIYQAVLKDQKVEPKNALFIDDNVENVNGAIDVGIRSIVYKNYDQLFKYMKSTEIV